MKTEFRETLIIVLFLASILSGQTPPMHYLDDYGGIPVVAVYTNRNAADLTDSNFQRLGDLGSIGILSRVRDMDEYSRIINRQLKVIPYNVWSTINKLSYYCDAVYSKWEAEGNMGNNSGGEVELKYDSSLGTIFTEGSIKGVITDSLASAGDVIYGPGYYQYIKYKLLPYDPTGLVHYTADFRLKIKQLTGQSLPQGYMDSVVCIIKVVASNPSANPVDFVVVRDTLRVSDFIQGGGWDTWAVKSLSDYTLDQLVNRTDAELKGVQRGTCSSYDSRWMQFKVYWPGRTFLKLFIDYVRISDQKGDYLVNNNLPKEEIFIQVSTYLDTSHVLGWMGLNEPSTLDSFEPIRIAENIVDSASNHNIDLYQTFTSGWMGLIGYNQPGFIEGNGYVITALEYMKRTKLPYISYNMYNYDFPYYPSDGDDYYIRNIDDYVIRNLRQLDSANIPFAFSTQTGKFYQYNDSCNNTTPNYRVPSSAEMIYHINLGLMYGMKELTMDPFFTLNQDDNSQPCYGQIYREGLVNIYNNTLTDLGLTWKEKVFPRMSGLVGKTVKYLHPWDQYHNQQTSYTEHFDRNYIYTIYDYPVTDEGGSIVDVGFFEDTTDSGKKYFMLLSRYYNTNEIFNLVLQDLSGYTNWEITDYVDTTKNTFESSGPHNRLNFSTTITPGDCRFFSILPVVKYGGNLLYNETISSQNSLQAKMTIHSGATLTINSTYNLNDTIVVDSGATLVINSGAVVNLISGTIINNGTLDINGGTLKFNQGICLRNNALMNADNALFTAYSQSWGGIYYNTGSTGYLDSSTVEKVYSLGGMITIEDCSPDITNSTIKDGYYHSSGIAVLNGATPQIYNNDISDIPESGIYVDHSSPVIGKNRISKTTTAVKCLSYSDPYFFDAETYYGLNTLSLSDHGVYASYYSTLYMGDESEFGSYNRILDNSEYNAEACQYSTIYAQLNWWGEEKPDEDKFEQDLFSEILFDPYLTGDPEGEYLVEGEGNYSYLSTELLRAKKLMVRGNYSTAQSILRQIITGYPVPDRQQWHYQRSETSIQEPGITSS